MEMTAATQYILLAAQLLGSQENYKKSRMTILGLDGVLFCENKQNGSSYVLKKIFTWMLMEARGNLKAKVGKSNNQTITLLTYVSIFFCFFQPESCFPQQAMLKSMPEHIGHCGPKPG